MGVLTLSIVQVKLLEGKEKCGYMALVLGQTSSQVSLIFVVAVDIVIADVVVVADNIVNFTVSIDMVDTSVAIVVAEWE